MPKIILKFPQYELVTEISLADILRTKKLIDLSFNVDWKEEAKCPSGQMKKKIS